MNGQIEPMIGRYVHVDIGGEMHRIITELMNEGLYPSGDDAADDTFYE